MQTSLPVAANMGPARAAGASTKFEDDAILVGRIAANDKNAMHILFARHHTAVHRFVLRRIRDQALAEDVTSDVFLDVWRQAGRFEGRAKVSTWILAIARNKAIEADRRSGRTESDDALADIEDDDENDAFTTLQIQDRSAVIRTCLSRLSAQHREIIDLVYYQEQPVQAIAKILAIPENTVKTRMFYARQRLARELEKSGVDRTWI
jgi:RNA polymerase sigma-70 factor (ECF subfamily)